MNRVRRYDMVELLAPAQETPEGLLLLEGIVAKPGVLEYPQPDGSIIRELIPLEELRREDSIRTLGLKPFTNEHPKVPVDINNMAEFRKGNVLQEIDSLNGFVKVRIMVDDPVTKDEIKRDGLRGLSPGYTVRIDKTSGVHPEFGPYDQIQRDRRYNHVAGTRKPRAGFAAHVRLDSGDAILARADQEHLHALPGGQDFVTPTEDDPDHVHTLPQGNGTTGAPISTPSGDHTHEIPGRFGGGETGVSQTTTPPTEKQDSVKALPRVRLDGLVLEMPDLETALAVNQYRKDAEARITALEARLDAGNEIMKLVDSLEMTTDAEARADIFGRLKGALKALFRGRPGKRDPFGRRKKSPFERIGPKRRGLFDAKADSKGAWLSNSNQAPSPRQPRVDAQTTYKDRLVNAHRRPVE